MRPSLRTSAPVAFAAALIAAPLGAMPASAAAVKVDYGIWLGAFPIGEADLATTFEGSRYKMNLQVRLTGLAGLLTGGKGAGASSGSIAGARPTPTSFTVTSQSSDAQRTVRMGLSSGSVGNVQIVPPLEERSDRVPVRESHKRGVVDPLSALLMPAVARGPLTDPDNCNRTLPVFDGGARFDIVLSYSETRNVEKPGYKGPVIVCSARYVPVAGHRADRPGTKFMEDNRDMAVWLAPVEGARLLLPMRIEVRTQSGMSRIEASRWVADSSAKGTPTTASVQVPAALE